MIRIREASGTYKLALQGELDLATSVGLQEELQAAQESEADRIVVDLSSLEFIDSSGLRALIMIDAEAKQDSDRFYFVPGGDQVRRAMELTDIDKRLRFMEGDSSG